MAAGLFESRSYNTSPVSAFRTTACKVPSCGLEACSSTEQERRVVAVGEADGLADSEAVGDSVGIGTIFDPPPVTAKPPMMSVRTRSPEPDPMRTSRR